MLKKTLKIPRNPRLKRIFSLNYGTWCFSPPKFLLKIKDLQALYFFGIIRGVLKKAQVFFNNQIQKKNNLN